MPSSIENRAYEFVAILREKYTVFAKYYPLTKKIKNELIAELGDQYSKRIINKALSIQTQTVSYLRKTVKFEKRYNLKNKRCEVITEQEKDRAKELCKIKTKKDKEFNFAYKNRLTQDKQSSVKATFNQQRTFSKPENKTQCVIKPKRRVLSIQK